MSWDDLRAPTFERFLVERRLGEGSFGVVWLARRDDRDDLVAIKVPRHSRLVEFPALREAFDREIDAALHAPRHPNVLRALERTEATLEDGSRVPALVCEYVPGARGLLEHSERRGLDQRQRLDLFLLAARGVAELQKHGSIHTDLKPQNILVGLDDVPRVADFGGLRHLSQRDTAPAQVSYRFAAPEVFDDQPETLDHRAVVYSLGKILAELLAGSDTVALPPHQSRTQAAELVRAWRPDLCRERLDGGWRSVLREIERATAADRVARHPNAEAFVDALQAAAASPFTRVRRKTAALLDETPRPVHRAVVGAFLVLGAVVAAVIAGQGLALRGQWSPTNFPKVVLPLPETDGIQHVSIVSIASAEEAMAFAGARGIEGVTEERATWRAIWARVVTELARCQPRAIVFDIAFPGNDRVPAQTTDLASALETARTEFGVPVTAGLWDAWSPAPHDALLDRRLASRMAPQQAGSVEFDPNVDCQDFMVVLALVPMDPIRIAHSLSLSAVLAALYRPSGPGQPPAPPCDVALDAGSSFIELRGLTSPGGRLRVDRSPTLAELDAAAQGAARTAANLPQGWSRSRVTAAIRHFPWPRESEFVAVHLSLDEAMAQASSELAGQAPDLIRGRVVLLCNTATQPSGQDDTLECHGTRMPKAYFHAQAIESMLDEIAVDPRLASTLPLGGRWHVGMLLVAGIAGLLLGLLLATVAGALAPARRRRAWQAWPTGRRTTVTILLLGVACAGVLLIAAACRLVAPLHHAEIAMTTLLAACAGVTWRVIQTRPQRAVSPEGPARSFRTPATLSLAVLAAMGALSSARDGASHPGALANPGLVVPALLGPAGECTPPVPGGEPRQSWRYPNRYDVRQWYTNPGGSLFDSRRNTSFAVMTGQVDKCGQNSMLRLKATSPAEKAKAYFTTSVGISIFDPPTGEELIKPISTRSKTDDSLTWWYPWLGQGPVQGGSVGQVAVVVWSGPPGPNDPPGSTVELNRFYLVEPNAGSTLQLFDTTEDQPKPLITGDGLVGTGFKDYFVDVRVVMTGDTVHSVDLVAPPAQVTAMGTPEAYAELAELKVFAVSNGLRTPDVGDF